MKIKLILTIVLISCLPLARASAMPVGTLLYRTSGEGKMYGYNSKDLIVAEKGKLSHIYSGHAAIYVGKENGVDYIVEMQPKGAIKVPAKYFINEALGERFIGAKLPEQASPLQIAKAVSIAKNLADNGSAYDFDFKHQKGPESGEWTCSGLTEKIYESANVSNPTNLQSLEYDPNYYAVDITSDGYDYQSIYNSKGDCFASDLEYSKIERKKDMLIPAPELIGFDVGLEYEGNRYIFLPYTQYLQDGLKDVPVDIQLSSSFQEPEVRGDSPVLGLILKWSLINNPISTIKNLAGKVSDTFVAIKDKVFPDSGAVLAESNSDDIATTAASSSKITKSTTSKATSSKIIKTTVSKTNTSKSTTSKATTTKEVPKIEPKTPVIQNIEPTTTKTNSIIRTSARPQVPAAKTSLATSSPVVSQNVIPVIHPTSTLNVPPEQTPTSTDTIEESASDEPDEPEPISESPKPIALIAKIYSDGGNDWLEIVNASDFDFDLAEAGYRLEKAKTASDPTLIMRFGNESDGVYPGGTIIKAHGKYLVASDTASEDIKAEADAIATKDGFSWTEDSYTIYLGTASISSDEDADIIDKLGYGEANYFEGAPASALKKGYALERKASATSTIESLSSGGLEELWPRLFDSDDNSQDFLLIPYDLSLIESENQNEADEEPSNSDLFVNPTGLDSDNMTQLWHFDECYGINSANELQESGKLPVDFKKPDKWLPGKWGCGASLSFSSSSTKAIFISPLDPNQFSLNFYYRNTADNMGIVLKLGNSSPAARQANIEFSPYYTSVYGFPGPEGRLNEILWPKDYLWHQVSVVINRIGGYWSIYLDGKEMYSYQYEGIMPTFEYLEFSGSQVEPVAIDEVSIWNRSLPATELKTINLLNQPFNPYRWPGPQIPSKLEHYWNFDENTGLASSDIASSTMTVKSDQWDMEGRNSSGLKIDSNIMLPLPNLPVSDLSLSFWWRNTSSPNEGRFRISLRNGPRTIMSLTPTIFNASFNFNDYGETLVKYGESLIPNDNKWHHLALTYDSYRYLLIFYLDGEKKVEKQFVKLRPEERINTLEIIKENWTSSIDELKIWSGTLTASEVLSEYETLN